MKFVAALTTLLAGSAAAFAPAPAAFSKSRNGLDTVRFRRVGVLRIFCSTILVPSRICIGRSTQLTSPTRFLSPFFGINIRPSPPKEESSLYESERVDLHSPSHRLMKLVFGCEKTFPNSPKKAPLRSASSRHRET
jgi:hypothetical protein